MGRGVLNTPHQMSPKRGRMRVLGYFAGQFIGGVRVLPCLIVGRMQYAPTLTVDCIGSFCQSSDLDAPSDIPDKGTNAGARLFRRAIYWGRPGPAVPVCGAYSIRPYPDGRLFSSEGVGAQQHTPHKTSPKRGRGWGWGLNVTSVFGTAEGAEGA